MMETKIPGFGYSDSEDEREAPPSPPMKHIICFKKVAEALEFHTVPPSTSPAVIKELMCLDELIETEPDWFGIELNEEDIDWEDDNYIDCDLCDKVYKNSCKKHPLLIIPDKHCPAGTENRAAQTLPGIAKIQKSKIPNAGMCVVAATYLPRGFVFGPYQGIDLDDSKMAQTDGYCWEIKKNGEVKLLDGSNERYSNWMRYINHSVGEKDQNMIAFQHNGSVYYRIIKPIHMDEELLVYYGESFNTSLTQGGPHNPFSRSPKKTRRQLRRSHPFIL